MSRSFYLTSFVSNVLKIRLKRTENKRKKHHHHKTTQSMSMSSSNEASLVTVGCGQKVATQFKSPCLSTLHGSTACGKSWLTCRIMRHASDLYDQEIAKILYCYMAHQPLFMQMEREIDMSPYTTDEPTRLRTSVFSGEIMEL